MKKPIKLPFIAILCAAALFSFAGCSSKSSDSEDGVSASAPAVSEKDIAAAKEAADRYCETLMEKNPDILSVNYTGNDEAEGNYFTFECELEYDDGSTLTGTISVMKNEDGTFKVQELSFM